MLADLKGVFCCKQSSRVPDEDFCPWGGQIDVIIGPLYVETWGQQLSSYGFYVAPVRCHICSIFPWVRAYLPILYSSRLYPRWRIKRFTPSAAVPFQLGQVSGHRGLYLPSTDHTVAHLLPAKLLKPHYCKGAVKYLWRKTSYLRRYANPARRTLKCSIRPRYFTWWRTSTSSKRPVDH